MRHMGKKGGILTMLGACALLRADARRSAAAVASESEAGHHASATSTLRARS